MAGLKDTLKRLLFFREPEKIEKFILKENSTDRRIPEPVITNDDLQNKEEQKSREKNETQNKKKNEDLLLKNSGKEKQDAQKNKKKESEDKSEISTSLSDNLEYMKKIYTVPINGDVVIREFKITFKDKTEIGRAHV